MKKTKLQKKPVSCSTSLWNLLVPLAGGVDTHSAPAPFDCAMRSAVKTRCVLLTERAAFTKSKWLCPRRKPNRALAQRQSGRDYSQGRPPCLVFFVRGAVHFVSPMEIACALSG
jgi:hypothetical protein